MSPTASVSSAFIGNRHSSSQGIKETAPARVLNRETEFPSSSSSRQLGQLIKPESSNGLTRGFSGFSQSPSPMMGITRQQQPNLTNEAKPGWQQQGLLFPYNRQEFHRFPLDLNARLVSPNSPGSNQQTCSSSSQHPDLALQLWIWMNLWMREKKKEAFSIDLFVVNMWHENIYGTSVSIVQIIATSIFLGVLRENMNKTTKDVSCKTCWLWFSWVPR